MKDSTAFVTALFLTLTMITIGVFWERFRYSECKRVGHSTTYCVLTLSN